MVLREHLKTVLSFSSKKLKLHSEDASFATHVEWAKRMRPFHPCNSHWSSSLSKKFLWWCFLTMSFSSLTMSGSSGSCLRLACRFLTCHRLYFSGRSMRSTPSQAMAFSAQRPSMPCSSTNRCSLSRGTIVSNMSNSAE